MPHFGPTFIIALEGLLIGLVLFLIALLAWMIPAVSNERRSASQAKEQALKEAEIKVNASIVESKEAILAAKEKVDKELKDKEASLRQVEDKLDHREDTLEARREQLQERENYLHVELRSLAEHRSAVERRAASIQDELQRVSRMTKEQAREVLLKGVEDEFRATLAKKAAEVERQTQHEAERKAKKVLLDVMQRHASSFVADAPLAVVDLPSEDMKGRIIGREGRNIRSFEQITGVDLIIDETPEAVVISCFDPVRREVARLTLMNLILDGRIQPGRIEELFENATAEVNRMIKVAGERAAAAANVSGLPAKVSEAMGRLRFRTSYAQNVLDHSVEVAKLAASLAAELGFDVEIAKRAGYLHDIGKGLIDEWEGPHALTGMEFLRQAGEQEPIFHAVGAHHYEIEPQSAEAILVIIADTISASREGARKESHEHYIKRLSALEGIGNQFIGVEKTFAVQAGREVRLIVKPEQVDDLGARRLANDVARKIENELAYPGQIKVTVIRETRVTDVAR